nr:hypothetical protein [Natranaerofaba carboxydovora]
MKFRKVWNPSDLFKIDMPQEMMAKQKQKAVKQAAKLLTSLGLINNIDFNTSAV